MLARILDGSGEGIVVYDREMRYRVWNRFMVEHTGLSADQVRGRVATEVFPVIIEQGGASYIQRALAGELVQVTGYHLDNAETGEAWWVSARWEPFTNEHGETVGVIAHFQDVTDRKRAEDALRSSESQFRTIIESASDVVTIMDREGVTRYASPALTPTLGWAQEDVVGQNPVDRIHADDRQHVLDTFRAILHSPGETQRAQYRSRHADGRWRVLLSSARNLLDDPSVRGVVITSRDVTDWVELQARLHQSQRIEAVGRLAGGVAHDFNNLLTVIRGNAQLILAAGTMPDEMQSELDEIAQAADRAATLTRQLLAFSRQQVLQPRVLDLNEVLRAIWPLLERLVGEALTLELDASESLGAVTADPVQLEQVILNLVVNSRDAMPRGGRLQIVTRNFVADEVFARAHQPMGPGEYVQLLVRDEGEGMDETTKARAFDPFFTTKALGHGTGMGLATVYGVVKQSGGFIWLESAPGKGSTFTIYLPRTADAPRTVTPRSATIEVRHGSETILVAEDEQLVRAMTRRTLERAGYQVFEAVNGAHALVMARELGDKLDLLLTDIVMPEMGGRELAAALRLERPSVRILFMSGYAHEREAHLSGGGGISHFLHKPFTLDELRSRVRLLLDQATSVA